MMNNLAQIAQLLRGRDPQAIVMDMFKNQKITDPNVSRLIQLAQNGDNTTLVNFANELFRQKGLDLNQELNSFMSLIK